MAPRLSSFPVVRSHDPECVRFALAQLCGAHTVEFPSGTERFEGIANYAQLKSIGLTYCSFSVPTRLYIGESPTIRQQFCLAGHAATQIGRETIEVDERRSCITPGNGPVRVDFGRAYEQVTLKLDAEALNTKLTALLGAQPGGELRFERAVDHRPDSAAQSLRQLVLFAADQLSAAPGRLPEIMLTELEQLILLSFLHFNPNTFSRLLAAPAPAAAPWQVRRAEEFLAANWKQAVTIDMLSAALNVSARSLFKAFRDARGYSPMAFLRQVRLQHARAMLTAPRQGTSVTGVAFATGFQNHGHFARHYRQAYGELPAATLNRHR